MRARETLADIQLFLRVVQTGSLSAAGRETGMSTPSVVRHINNLEAALKVRLLNRSTRRLSLTEAGEIYKNGAEKILSALASTHKELGTYENAPRGTLHIASRTLVGINLVTPLLPEFAHRFPDLHILFTLTDAPIDIIDQKVDVLITSGRIQISSLLARKLAAGPRILCASTAYLAAREEPRSPHDLTSHKCVSYRFDALPPVWRFGSGKSVIDVAVNSNFQTNSGEVIRTFLLKGLGIGLMPQWSVAADIEAGHLRRVLPKYNVSPKGADAQHTIYAVYPRGPYQSRKARTFIDFIVGKFRRMEYFN